MSHTCNCQLKRNRKTVSVPDVAKWDTEDGIVKPTHGANFASWIRMPRKRATSMKNLCKTTPLRQAEETHRYRFKGRE